MLTLMSVQIYSHEEAGIFSIREKLSAQNKVILAIQKVYLQEN